MFHSEFHLASLGSLPFDAGTFDMIFSEYVFEHLADPERVLTKSARRERLRQSTSDRRAARLIAFDLDHLMGADQAIRAFQKAKGPRAISRPGDRN
jgi:2-polyprenyl-3-methyl-5-hydroxy-6-metoxy-1,4-benzoquinol methylase